MTPRRPIRLALAAAMVLVLTLMGGPAAAQEPPPPDVPTQDIIPEPNSGAEPTEAGDRGGALQLLLLGAVAVGIGGIVLHVANQARRGRARHERQPSSASQAPTPSRKPDR